MVPAPAPVGIGVEPPRVQPVAPDTQRGRIRFECEPSDAMVIVDGVTRGRAGDFSGPRFLTLEPGTHRIELRKNGYATYRTEVFVAAEVLETIPVRLRRLPAQVAQPDEEEDHE